MKSFKSKKIIFSQANSWQPEAKNPIFVGFSGQHLLKNTSSYFRYLVLMLFGLMIASYLGWQVWQILTPPELSVERPAELLEVSDNQLEIYGWVEPGSELTVNGEVTLSNIDGYFWQEVNLRPGANEFIFSAKKRYSQPIVLTRQVYYQATTAVNQAGSVKF